MLRIERKDLQKINDYLWEIPQGLVSFMKVPARFYSNDQLLEQILTDRSLEQLVNVTSLPGIYKYSLAMPDIHEGYGFPIGGVAAINLENGVISPGGIGYDINCGVRLLISNLNFSEIENKLKELANLLFKRIPSGVGSGGIFKLNEQEIDQVLEKGVTWAREKGFTKENDQLFLEENGCFQGVNTAKVSLKAKNRGHDQLGTLGSGNHFIEVQKVVEIFDQDIADYLKIKKDQITVLIHTGSRGLGHQVCTDYLKVFDQAMKEYNLNLPDRELACAPINSPVGQDYWQAMAAAANFAWTNRQILTHLTRQVFREMFSENNLRIIYDVAHNIAKIEVYDGKKFLIHRKGATRSFGKNNSALPNIYQSIGQPVIIPGSMGSYSYLLVGTTQAEKEAFGSTCHGAGRQMSRNQALREIDGRRLIEELASRDIIIKAKTIKGAAEEAPQAYKDINQVVEVVHQAGLAKKVCKLKPLVVVKG